MKDEYILVTGMVRSGTTLLSRAIDANSQAAVPPDPYFGFFRAFRNEIYKDYIEDFEEHSALSDHFFDHALEPKREIANSDLNKKIENQGIESIKKEIVGLTETNSPLVIPHVKDIEANTYKELFVKLMQIIKETYGDENTRWIGFKQTWVEEFINPLLNTFPEMKVVQIIRDPRALIASRTKTSSLSHNYPLYFLIKHWRRSFAYALSNLHYNEDNFRLIKYEEFTRNPEDKMKEICDFVGMDYQPKMIDPNSYRDGECNPWTDNSAYSSTTQITSRFNDKWKEVLSKEEIQYVEDLCDIEMDKLDYERKTEFNLKKSLFSGIEFDDEPNTSWIEKQSKKEPEDLDKIKNELLRNYVYRDGNNGKLDDEFLEMIFILPEFLELIEKIDIK